MTPSELLLTAADLIRDRAAAATEGPWRESPRRYTVRAIEAGNRPVADYIDGKSGDAQWIAMLSPVVAPHLEAWLRAAAASVKAIAEDAGWPVNGTEEAALRFALAVLGMTAQEADSAASGTSEETTT